MKEIDLLPEWYRSSKRRRISYRTQYVALGCIFAVIMILNFTGTYSISKTKAQLVQAKPEGERAEYISQEFDKIKSQITQLKEKADTLEKVDSKIDVASVLAEISFLIGEKIVLSKVDLKADRFDLPSMNSQKYQTIRNTSRNTGDITLLDSVRFKILISGVAAEAADIAKLVSRLEDSPYFQHVCLSFSRNTEVKAETNLAEAISNTANGPEEAGKIYSVSEFEIICYLANYTESN